MVGCTHPWQRKFMAGQRKFMAGQRKFMAKDGVVHSEIHGRRVKGWQGPHTNPARHQSSFSNHLPMINFLLQESSTSWASLTWILKELVISCSSYQPCMVASRFLTTRGKPLLRESEGAWLRSALGKEAKIPSNPIGFALQNQPPNCWSCDGFH